MSKTHANGYARAAKESLDAIHPSRRSTFTQNQPSSKKRKRQIHDKAAGAEDKKAVAVAPAKRIRNIRRLLQHSQNLGADVRVGYERELAALEHERKAAKNERERSEMIRKYHMVRFFERRKAERFLKQAQKRLNSAHDGQEAEMAEEIHALEVDLKYTTHYPLMQKYSSLYSLKADGSGVEKYRPNRDQAMWTVVEAAMTQGTLEDLRNKKIEDDSESNLPAQETSDQSPKANINAKHREKRSKVATSQHAEGRKVSRKQLKQLQASAEAESHEEADDGVGFFEY